LEHRWGRNIPDHGLGSLGATLAARLLTEIEPRYYVINVTRAGVPLIVRIPLGTEDGPYGIILRSAEKAGNFPYGFKVEPDERL
jgi:hypothetical protein